MDKVVLGKTGLEVNKNGFGALPIQRVSKKEAVYLLQKAFYNGINYFDTARALLQRYQLLRYGAGLFRQ